MKPPLLFFTVAHSVESFEYAKMYILENNNRFLLYHS